MKMLSIPLVVILAAVLISGCVGQQAQTGGNGTNVTPSAAPSGNQTAQLLADGNSCTFGNECSGGFCVHNVCRSASYYCGDGLCDTGENCNSCQQDCGACATGQICTPDAKRCGTGKVEMCSNDGKSWIAVTNCQYGCDATKIACNPKSYQVNMTATGFVPSVLDISRGEIVIFYNADTSQHQPASDPHPIHTAYPTFVAPAPINPGATWSFTFDNTGTWTYHDEMLIENHGTITVR